MFKTKAQKRQIAQLDELIDIAKKINDNIVKQGYLGFKDPAFDEVFSDYTAKLDKIANEILAMGKVAALFFSGPLLRKLLELKALNNVIVIWLDADFQKTQLKTTE